MPSPAPGADEEKGGQPLGDVMPFPQLPNIRRVVKREGEFRYSTELAVEAVARVLTVRDDMCLHAGIQPSTPDTALWTYMDPSVVNHVP